MPVTMGGVASGMDTDAIIEKLVNVEAQPIKQLQRDIAENRNRKNALQVLSNQLKELQKVTKDLYGFRASYDDKKATSSDPGVLTVTASRLAEKGLRKIEVKEIASTHKIVTDELDSEKEISSGKFTIKVQDESYTVRFKGGSLKALQQKIDDVAAEKISTSLVRTSGNSEVLTLESKVPGKKGEMILKGDEEFLRSIGLVNGKKPGEKAGAGLVFDKRYFTSYMGTVDSGKQNGSIEVSNDGKKITLKGLLWQEFSLPVSTVVQKDTVLEFTSLYSKEKKEEEQIPFKIETGPQDKITVKGIELNGYNVSRIRPLEKKKPEKEFDSLLGVGIVSIDAAGKRVEKIYPVNRDAKGLQEIPIGKDFAGKSVSKVVFYCNDGTCEFLNARIATPEKEKEQLEPKNVIARASDAKIKVDGIEITREKNNDLKDIIKGVTLDLHSPSSRPVIVKIEPDLEKALGKIRAFVESYNKYVDLHRELTKVERTNKPGDYKKSKDKNGLFVGDMTIIRLENLMKTTINGAYNSRAETPIRIFTQMGVSTGKINSEWQSIKDGKLVIDEGLLKQTINENPEGVRLFFGSDTDGDNREDSGMAFTLNNQLDAYVGFGRNIINSKIDLENENIKLANERIERQEDHLKKYEDKLRRKFASMEEAISGAKAQRNWMNQQLGGNSGGQK